MAGFKHALDVTREQDFSAWYQAVVTGADLAENSTIRGCMVIKPYGFAIWELMQKILDDKFKEHDHVNAYFPLFIPLDLFEKEAEHVAGFAKEMAIVTHHRVEHRDGKLVPTSPLETPLAVRPTSELIIGESMARWVKSYRDLPLLVNQWCNVVRWEMRTRLFLRTTEFLWQEGHTAHETEEEARAETLLMHGVYKWFICDILKMFGIPGQKPEYDKFAGAVDTYTIEAMMQDGKALQSATSHYLGQNFSKAVGITFQGRDERLCHAHTTSWGISTRVIGGLIMSHSDDDGLNLPSAVAPYHVVIIPIVRDSADSADIMEYCTSLKKELSQKSIRAFVDRKEISPQNKKWDYVRKGVPLILEIGQREVNDELVCCTTRTTLEKGSMSRSEFVNRVASMVLEHDETLQKRCEDNCKRRLNSSVKTLGEMKEFFAGSGNGFVVAKFNPTVTDVSALDEMAVSVRCIPTQQSNTVGKCIITGTETETDAVFAKSY
ncbi:MAG: proline--tRNA ligase [Holosporales bacterium]|jgi:prolyl-tRNA synthetase|nr:proline--tRNA ligase [Holosporales bacterium]